MVSPITRITPTYATSPLQGAEGGVASEWEAVDAEFARRISGPTLAWAAQHGLWDTSDRQRSRFAVTAARLLAAAAPDRDPHELATIAALAAWLTLVDDAVDREALVERVVGGALAPADDEDAAPLARAGADLCARLGAAAPELLPELSPKLSPILVDADGAPGDDIRICRWIDRLAPALLGAALPPIHQVGLYYPRSWASEVNPRARAVEDEVGAWLRSVGVIRSSRGEAIFADLAAAEYAGWPCAGADAEALATVMGFFALWIFHDDALEGTGTPAIDLHADAVAGAVDPATCDADAPHLRGWAELGLRLRKTMSPTWLRRHGDRFHEWLSAVGWEAQTLRAYRRTGVAPSVDEYLALRRSTIGVSPTLDFIEYVRGFELAPERLASAPVVAISELAAELVAIHNDLFAFSKDVRQSMMNLVSSRIADDVEAARAFAEIALLHNRKVLALEAAAAELLAGAPADERPTLARWVAGVQRMIYGFAQWHVLAPRYTDIHRLPEGDVLRVRILVH